jgi:hypothetical protein
LDEITVWNRALSTEEINATYNSRLSRLNHNFTNLTEGAYIYKAYSIDSAGNMNSTEQRTLTIDTTSPLISFVPPTDPNNSFVSRNWSYVNVSTSDVNEHSAFIDWNDSLVGWWSMDFYNSSGVYDNSTWNNFGTFQGGLGTNNITAGKYGKGLEFNGLDQYLSINDDNSLDVREYLTLEAWVKPNSFDNTGGYEGIIWKLNSLDANFNTAYMLSTYWNSGNPTFIVTTSSSSFASDSYGCELTTEMVLDEWQHIAVTYDGIHNITKFYRNGQLDAQCTGINGTINTSSNGCAIGKGPGLRYFNGSIDEARIWNRVLSEEELNASYNAGIYHLQHNFTSLTEGTYNYQAHAIDAAGNTNKTGLNHVTIDTILPTISIQSPLNQTYTSQGINLNVTTSEPASTCLYFIDSQANATLSNDSSTNWFSVISTTDGSHNLSVYCNDTAGNWGLNNSIWFTRDTQSPSWSSNYTNSVSTYSPTQQSCLNITWQDSISGMYTVLIQGNWSDSDQNYTTQNQSSQYYYCTIMPVGTFYWKSWANDTQGNLNQSDTWIFTIQKASNSIFLYLNSTQSNLTISFTETSNASAYISFGTANLYIDNSPVSNPDTSNLAAGYYVYLANSSGDSNHTINSTYLGLTVNQITSVTSLFLNNTQDNLTQTFGQSVNVSAYCDYGTPTLYLNSSSVSNPYIESLGSSYYNLTAYCSGDSNHTSSSKTFYLTVNKASNPIFLYLNSSQSNQTISFGETINASAYVQFGTASLYRNGQSVSNPEIANLAAGYYVYLANSSGDSNHTINSTYFSVTVNQVASTTGLFLNSTQDNLTITFGQSVNASAYCNYGTPTLYLNSSSVSNPYIESLGSSYYNLTAYCSGDSNHTSSSKQFFLTVNKASNPISLYLNSSQSNLTVSYGETSNATAYVSFGSVQLFRNNSAVSNPEVSELPAGYYIYLANSSGDSNHTANSTYFSVTVTSGSSVTTVYLNGSSSDPQISFGETVNATAFTNYGSITFFLNSSSISNPYINNLGAGYYNFTAYSSGDGNHSASSDISFLTANKIASTTSLFLNNTQDNLTLTFGQSVNASAYCDYGTASLYLNSSPVSNPYLETLAASYYNFTAYCSGDSNHSASFKTFYLTVNKASNPISLFLNSSQSNLTISFGETSNATAYISFGSVNLYRNSTTVSNSEISELPAGYHTYLANSSGDSNHTVNSTYFALTVTSGASVTTVYLNSSSNDQTITFGEAVNATATTNYGSVTLFLNSSSVTNPYIESLAASYYNLTAYSTGDANHSASSDTAYLTVNKASNAISLFLNSSQSNQTIIFGETINASAYIQFGSVQLFRNGIAITNPEIETLGAGYYTYLANSSGDTNHTSNSTYFSVTVNQIISTTSLFLNGSQDNLTLTFGQSVNVSAYCDYGTPTLYLNSSSVSNPYIQSLASSYYNLTAYCSGDTNHSASSKMFFLTVSKASNPIFLYLNSTQSNLTISFTETSNASAYISFGTANLYIDNSPVSNPEIQNLGAGYHVYLANSSGDSNHTDNSTYFSVTVNQIYSTTSLFLNNTQDNLTITFGQSVNTSAYCDYGSPNLYLNSSSVSNPYIESLGSSYYNLTAYCSGDSNHSQSSKSLFLTVNQASNPIYLYLNSSQSNLTISFGETINASAYISFGSVSLYRNDSSVSNPEISDLEAGYHIYLANSSGDTNHTANSTYFALSVTSGSSITTVYLNSSSNDQTIIYGESINASAYTNYGSVTLNLNDSLVSNPYIENLAAGFYNLTAYSTGDANHTASSDTAYLTVNKASNAISLFLNSSQSNQTIIFGETSNATAYIQFGTANLYRDNQPVSNPDITNLAAGYYVYLANSSGDSNHTINSTYFSVTVNQISSTTSLFLNDSQDNLTETFGQSINASAYCDYGSPQIILNGTVVSNPYIQTLGAGYYNLTAYCSGDSNHTASSKQFFLTVNKASNPISLFLNSSQSNLTISFEETSNATAYIQFGSVNLYRNNSAVSNPEIQTPGAGYYIYLANSSGDGNHTSNSTYLGLTVNQITSTTSLFLNDSQDNLTHTYGQSVNASAYCDYVTPTLYLNSSSVSTPYIESLASGYYNFTAYCSGDGNHSSSSKTFFLTVNQASNPISLYLNSGQSNLTVSYGETSNATAYVSFGSAALYRNNTPVSNPEISELEAGYHIYLANSSGDTNHTANSTYFALSVTSGSSVTTVYLNGSSNDQTITFGESVNVTAVTNFDTVSLFLNDSSVSNPYIESLAAGFYNLTAYSTGDANHTASSDTAYLTVNKAYNPISLFLNNSQANLTISYGQTSNASTYVSFGSVSLFKNNTPVTNPDITNLGAGYYVYLANSSGDSNHTANSTYLGLSVNQITAVTSLFLNSSEDNLTITYGQSVNATAYCDYGTPSLYLNSSSVSNPYIQSLGAGFYNFTAYCSGDSNHSSSSKTSFLTMNRANAYISLSINPPSPVTYGTPITVTCSINATESPTSLYRNGSLMDSENSTPVTLAAGTYNFTCNSSQTQNYTAAYNQTTHEISHASMPLYLFLNGSQSSQSYSFGETTNATGYKQYSEGSLSLYRNSSPTSNPEVTELPAGYWNYSLVFVQTENYSANSTTLFATVTSGSSVTTVYLNGSSEDQSITFGETVNATATANYGSITFFLNDTEISSPYLENLAAGFYNLTAYCSGDSNHSASSDTTFLTVNQASNPIFLYLNGSQSNLTANYGGTTNATAYVQFGAIELYRNGSPVSNPDIQSFPGGVYVYLANSSGDQNHTANSTVLNVTVLLTPSTTSLFLNGTQDNLTQAYGQTANASASCDYGSAGLYMNETPVSNPYIVNLGAGYYNFSAYCSGDGEHTPSEKAYYLTVDKAPSPLFLFLNGSPQNLTSDYGETTNATAYASFGSVNLYRSGQAASNPDILGLEAGYYVYLANTSGDGNYSANSTYLGLTVSSGASIVNLFLNGSQSDMGQGYGDSVNVTASCSHGSLVLQINSSAISNPYQAVLGAGYYNFSAFCSGDANHSASQKAYFLAVSKASTGIYLFVNPVSPSTYGTLVTATCVVNNSEVTASLYRNGSLLSENGTAISLAARTYAYACNCSATGNYTSAENSTIHQVNRASMPLYLYLNGSGADQFYAYGEYANASGYKGYAEGTIALYRNGSEVSNPETTGLPAGYWNYTLAFNQTENYTTGSLTLFATVTEGASSTQILLNESSGDLTINYTESANASAWTNFGSLTFLLNGSSIGNPFIAELAVGFWNFSAYSSGDGNHTPSQDTAFLTVSRIPSNATVLLNGSQSDMGQKYGDSVNASAYCDYGSSSVYLNGSLVTNPFETSLAVGSWNLTGTCSGDQNHSVSSSSQYLTVNKADSGINLLLNGTDGDFVAEKGSQVNMTGYLNHSQSPTIYLYNNGSLLGSGSAPYGNISYYLDIGVFNITASYPGSQNYTAAEAFHMLNVTDTTPPDMIFVPPSLDNNSNTSRDWIFVNVSGNEALHSCLLEWNGSNQSMASQGYYCYANMTSLTDGNYYFRVWGNDSSGNMNMTSYRQTAVNLSIDEDPPELTFVPPTLGNQSTTASSWIDVNVSADEQISSCLLDWYNGTWTNVSMAPSGEHCYIRMEGLSQGYYYFRAWANDSSGNLNATEFRSIRYYVYVPPAEPPSGGGGGGGGAAAPVNMTNVSGAGRLIESPTSIYMELYQGDSTRANVFIRNTLGSSQTLSGLLTSGLRDILSFEGTSSIHLAPGSGGELVLKINVPEQARVGNHSGSLSVSAGNLSYSIPITIKVLELKKGLLDLKIEMIEPRVFAGSNGNIKVSLYNLGRTDRVDVQLKIQVIDSNGTVISEKEEAMAVETSLSSIIAVKVHEGTVGGRYVIKATACYTNLKNETVEASATDEMIVVEQEEYSGLETPVLGLRMWHLAVISIPIVAIAIIYYRHRRRFTNKVNQGKEEGRELARMLEELKKAKDSGGKAGPVINEEKISRLKDNLSSISKDLDTMKDLGMDTKRLEKGLSGIQGKLGIDEMKDDKALKAIRKSSESLRKEMKKQTEQFEKEQAKKRKEEQEKQKKDMEDAKKDRERREKEHKESLEKARKEMEKLEKEQANRERQEAEKSRKEAEKIEKEQARKAKESGDFEKKAKEEKNLYRQAQEARESYENTQEKMRKEAVERALKKREHLDKAQAKWDKELSERLEKKNASLEALKRKEAEKSENLWERYEESVKPKEKIPGKQVLSKSIRSLPAAMKEPIEKKEEYKEPAPEAREVQAKPPLMPERPAEKAKRPEEKPIRLEYVEPRKILEHKMIGRMVKPESVQMKDDIMSLKVPPSLPPEVRKRLDALRRSAESFNLRLTILEQGGMAAGPVYRELDSLKRSLHFSSSINEKSLDSATEKADEISASIDALEKQAREKPQPERKKQRKVMPQEEKEAANPKIIKGLMEELKGLKKEMEPLNERIDMISLQSELAQLEGSLDFKKAISRDEAEQAGQRIARIRKEIENVRVQVESEGIRKDLAMLELDLSPLRQRGTDTGRIQNEMLAIRNLLAKGVTMDEVIKLRKRVEGLRQDVEKMSRRA